MDKNIEEEAPQGPAQFNVRKADSTVVKPPSADQKPELNESEVKDAV